MSGPFGAGFGGGGGGAETLAYQGRLREYFDNLERQQAEADAQRLAANADGLFGPLMGNYSPEELQAHAGERNANGVIDPRFNPATQAMLQSLHRAISSGDPALQKAALNSLGRVSEAMMPNAPSWPTQGQPTDDMKEYQFARSQGYSGPLEQWLRQSQDAKRSQTVINNQTPFENEYDKALGKAQAEEFLSIQDAPKKRYGVVQQMEQIHNLLGNRGGFAGSTLQELKMAAQRLGVDVTGLDADQAAQALSNDLALKLRTTGEGGGMPGAMSDPDRVFLQKQVPGIEFTPEGRQRLIEVHRRLLQRENDVALAARDYAAQHGRLDAGFYNSLAKFRDHPLFDDLQTAKPQPPASAPASGSRITNFRRIQ